MAPQSVARGVPRSGIEQRRGCQTASKCTRGANSPLRGCNFLRKTLLCPSRSHHSCRRLSRIPSRKAAVAPARICSAVPRLVKRHYHFILQSCMIPIVLDSGSFSPSLL